MTALLSEFKSAPARFLTAAAPGCSAPAPPLPRLLAEMMVLDNRQDIIAWYQKCGYILTDETAPFPKGLNVGVPKVELQFVRLRRPMP